MVEICTGEMCYWINIAQPVLTACAVVVGGFVIWLLARSFRRK